VDSPYAVVTRKNALLARAGHSGRVGAAVGVNVGGTVVGAAVGGAVNVAQMVNPPNVLYDPGCVVFQKMVWFSVTFRP
jgi:hypothetical protein